MFLLGTTWCVLQMEGMWSIAVSRALSRPVLSTVMRKCSPVMFRGSAPAVVERTPLFVLFMVTAMLPRRFTWLAVLITTLIRNRAVFEALYLILTTCLGRVTRFPMPG